MPGVFFQRYKKVTIVDIILWKNFKTNRISIFVSKKIKGKGLIFRQGDKIDSNLLHGIEKEYSHFI